MSGSATRGVSSVIAGLCLVTAALLVAQTAPPRLPPAPPNPPAASLQAPLDPGYAALIATCKTPPPARGGRGPGGGARGAPAPQGIRDYAVTEIPEVITAGRKWTFVWQQAGNNGDGIVGTDDGGLLLAQNDSSKVVKLDKNGKTVRRLLRHAHRRRVVDELEGRAVHRRARSAMKARAAGAAA